MEFGNLLSESWKEYKSNFPAIGKTILYLYALPLIIIYILGLAWIFSTGTYTLLNEQFQYGISNPADDSISNNYSLLILKSFFSPMGIALFGILFIVFVCLEFLGMAGIIARSLKPKKWTFLEVFSEGKRWFWPTLGFATVSSIFLLGLFLLLIIPGIIFLFYWIFSYYIFINEKKGIIDSLKSSFHLVKGRWWMTFGYSLLLFLIITVIGLVFSIPGFILGVIGFFKIINGSVDLSYFLTIDFISNLFEIASTFITYPLIILFFKNFYLAIKKEKKIK